VVSIFSQKYLTTVGVKVDKKIVAIDGRDITLMLWDLAGEDEFQSVQMTYFRGAAGYLLVADGTRRSTLQAALMLRQRVEDSLGKLPFVLVLNKTDLADGWELDEATIAELEASGCTVIKTSAKTGDGVEEAFSTLARMLVG